MNPYEVLGLRDGATFEEVRSTYKKLAKQNHPDRHHHLSADDRAQKEEYFKKVTVAYHLIVDSLDKDDGDQPTYNWTSMKEVLMNTFVDVATKYLTRKDHHITVPISLQDIYTKKRKKLQIFLKGVKEPVFLHIVCDRLDMKMDVLSNDGEVHQIHIHLDIQDHDLFYMNGDDIIAHVLLDWGEYLAGKTIHCTFLDGAMYDIIIDPFSPIGETVMHPSGKFKVCADIACPSEHQWLQLDESDRTTILNILKKIRAQKR